MLRGIAQPVKAWGEVSWLTPGPNSAQTAREIRVLPSSSAGETEEGTADWMARIRTLVMISTRLLQPRSRRALSSGSSTTGKRRRRSMTTGQG